MKRILAFILALAMSLSLLTACGDNANKEQDKTDLPKEDTANDRSTVSKIAVLLPGSITDESWNQTAYEGLQTIAAQGYETAYTENVGSNDMESVFRSYCEEGYDFVIGHGAQYGDACCRVAEDYPNVNFFITGNAPEDVPADELPANIMFADYRECEGAYVCGVVAALMTKSGKVGYVGGGNNTTQQSDKNAFIDGVASVSSEIEVKTVITGTFDDSALGKETAIAMMEDGVDVALERFCRCARDAYKTDVQVEDIPDAQALHQQQRQTRQALDGLAERAWLVEASRKRVGCLPLAPAEVEKRIQTVLQAPAMPESWERRRAR